MMLYVNGQDIARLALGLVTEAGEWHELPQIFPVRPEDYLKTVEAFLRTNNMSLDELTGFALVKGPGSATSLRTSHALINALAFALQVPVKSVEKPGASTDSEALSAWSNAAPHSFALPLYSQDPHITPTKRDALKRKTS